MKPIRCLGLLVGALFFIFSQAVVARPHAAEAHALPATKVLQKQLDATTSYQAAFNQVTYAASGKVTASTHGKVYLRRPGQFRWQSEKPTEQILYANGLTMWVYDVDLQQATKRKLSAKDDLVAQLLTGDSAKILTSYQVSILPRRDKGQWFRLKPVAKRGEDNFFQYLDLHFIGEELVSLSMQSNLDEHTIIRFSNIRRNHSLASRLFHFKPPAGVDVLSEYDKLNHE